MDEFPFSPADWQRVVDASLPVTNAALADDHEVHAAAFTELVSLLNELRDKYGDHPVLIETEADFESDASRQVQLYRRAIDLAERHSLPTLSIRLSFADILLDPFADRVQARRELTACQAELDRTVDAYDRAQWNELMSGCDDR